MTFNAQSTMAVTPGKDILTGLNIHCTLLTNMHSVLLTNINPALLKNMYTCCSLTSMNVHSALLANINMH